MAIEVGEKVPGKVSGITNFGAFIDLGSNKSGLVHISQVSDGYVKNIHDVLEIGDEVTVKVLSIGNDGKIALSIRQAQAKLDQTEKRPRTDYHNDQSHGHYGSHSYNHRESFDDLMSGFLKESEDRLATLKRNTEGKRGGRGGRRN